MINPYLNKERRAALDIANKVRKELGHKPRLLLRSGVIGSQSSCPIARTINEGYRISVIGGMIYIQGGLAWAVPREAQNFIRNFDSQKGHRWLEA